MDMARRSLWYVLMTAWLSVANLPEEPPYSAISGAEQGTEGETPTVLDGRVSNDSPTDASVSVQSKPGHERRAAE